MRLGFGPATWSCRYICRIKPSDGRTPSHSTNETARICTRARERSSCYEMKHHWRQCVMVWRGYTTAAGLANLQMIVTWVCQPDWRVMTRGKGDDDNSIMSAVALDGLCMPNLYDSQVSQWTYFDGPGLDPGYPCPSAVHIRTRLSVTPEVETSELMMDYLTRSSVDL
ncbi:hypothetical protein BO86DRAFT_35352 [Aspergillus japonicus CBS 114.51]|uniref:Uncharacterized protein n=1 Tax=Aspergillus japonicus CBS 114.51 TaxID=1448312 RepID=A0A8T8X8R5_ASPJA|nr:hypothetical protein BO86DRAFT_35352 [Aspergillus japonicus CBS 114.51]RAH83829.1 hypothetical protein BO86DRAFT_35352 [Aspergillus japonicus CBS 114.51]